MRVLKGSTALDADVSLRSLNVSAYSDVAPCTSHRAWTFHSRGQLASTLCLLAIQVRVVSLGPPKQVGESSKRRRRWLIDNLLFKLASTNMSNTCHFVCTIRLTECFFCIVL